LLSRRQTRERTALALARADVTSELRRRELLDYVVSINSEVAQALVAPYANRGLETDQLLQVGHAALARAARDFDPGQHDEFVTFAVPLIRGDLKNHCRDQGWTVRPSRSIQ